VTYRSQCRCPNGHLIEAAFANTTDENADAEQIGAALSTTLKFSMELWMLDGKLGNMCEICKAPANQFVFTVDSVAGDCTKERMQELTEHIQPELMKQRALRHARKNRN